MKEYPNFYENIKEAEMRLKDTVVLYDGEPYYVLCICDHKPDGIFRMYLDPIGRKGGLTINSMDVPYQYWDNTKFATRGAAMDDWMDKNPDTRIIRKMMNSPLFNKFRPFDLGMCNVGSGVQYIERSPTRHTQQGLTAQMLSCTVLSIGTDAKRRLGGVHITSESFRDCVVSDYPSISECLDNLKDPKVSNEGAAFHRNFAFVRGPIDTMFLAYKSDIVGLLPYGDLSSVKLSPQFRHVKEAVTELNVFGNVIA